MAFQREQYQAPPKFNPVIAQAVAEDLSTGIGVTRFTLADVPGMGEWLLKRLTSRWPHFSEATFAGRLRAWIGSNSHFLVKTANGVGLATSGRTELDPCPYGEQVFLFLKDQKRDEDEGIAIYGETRRWAKSIGCERLRIDRKGDIRDAALKRRLAAEETIEMFFQL